MLDACMLGVLRASVKLSEQKPTHGMLWLEQTQREVLAALESITTAAAAELPVVKLLMIPLQ